MRYLPINIDIRNRKVIIVGGGPVAERKCLALLDAGARVSLIAPEITDTLFRLGEAAKIELIRRPYSCGDLEDAYLAFAATDSTRINRLVAEEAKIRGILADIAGEPESGSFTSPAYFSRGDLLVTVSTGGKSPLLSAAIRADLEGRYGHEYAMLTEIMGKVREKLLTEKDENQYNKQIFQAILDSNLPGSLRTGDFDAVDRTLTKLCGPGFTLTELGIEKKESQ